MAEELDVTTMEFPDMDPGTLPTSLEPPLGEIIFEIKSVGVEYTKENVDGAINPKTGQLKVGHKKTMVVQFSIAEPEELAGFPHTERFYIGSDADPEAAKEGTWRRNGTLFMRMLKNAGVGGKTMREWIAAASGQKVGGTVKVEKSKDPQYSDRNRIKDYWQPGSKIVKVIEATSDIDAALPPLPPAETYQNND